MTVPKEWAGHLTAFAAQCRAAIEAKGGDATSGRMQLLRSLADMIAERTASSGLDANVLKLRLLEMASIVHDAFDLLNAEPYRDLPAIEIVNERDRKSGVTEEQKAKKRANSTWYHRNLNAVFSVGQAEQSYVSIDADELEVQIGRYLSRDWLSCAHLDWAFGDALVANEAIATGEAAKRGIRFAQTQAYNESSGNVAKMPLLRLKSWAIKWAVILGFPGVPLVVGANIDGWLSTALLWAGGGFAFFSLLYIGGQILNALLRLLRLSPETHEKKLARLYQAQVDFYRLWSGPVINPAIIREELRRTHAMGVVWRPILFCLVDRAHQRDPACWPGRHVQSQFGVSLWDWTDPAWDLET